MDITLDASPVATIEDVYRGHAVRMWRSVRAWSGDASIAEDAVAEAFAQALRRGPELRDPERWVWRAAYRIAAGLLVERRRRPDARPSAPTS
jgi:RNA polymerase sigma-70 factor, ECF subfamily